MNEQLPSPLVPADIDVRELPGFMLNTERLMASELVALSSHEAVAAALFLWCRAWKQVPAASLPNDERVIAAFARLPLGRFKKLRAEVLRGFVLCDDGRLYHRVLAVEALNAFNKKHAFRARREKDAERLRGWRANKFQTKDETRCETADETRFVREGQGQGQGHKERKNAAPLRDAAPEAPSAHDPSVVSSPEADLFRRGKEVLGSSAGGMIRKVLAAKGGSIPLARAAMEQASTKGDPREYLGAIIAGKERDGPTLTARDRGDAW